MKPRLESLSGAESADRQQAQQLFWLHNPKETGLLWHASSYHLLYTLISRDPELFLGNTGVAASRVSVKVLLPILSCWYGNNHDHNVLQ